MDGNFWFMHIRAGGIRMSPADKHAWSERSAKLAFLMLGLHLLVFLESVGSDSERALLRLLLLAAYAVCLWRLDWAIWKSPSRRGSRPLTGYWLAATLCACANLIWGEHWLASSNEILKLLFSAAILPYGQIFSVNYQGWPWENSRLCASVGAIAILILCLAHLFWYIRISLWGKEE